MRFARNNDYQAFTRRAAMRAGVAAGLASLAGFGRSPRNAVSKAATKLRPPKILVAFSWSFKNIGDIAITPGLFRLLEEYVPSARITLICNSSIDQYRAYLSKRFPDVRTVYTPFRSSKPAPKEFRQAFEEADFLLYNSGTTLSYGRWERNWNRTMPLAMPLFMARIHGKPYGIYCQSFERFAPPSDLLFPKLLSDAQFVFCRDTDSLEYLKSLGVQPPVLEFGPDSTFAFNLRDEAFADRFLARHRLQPRRFITLTIRSRVQGFLDEKREQAHAAKLRRLVIHYVRKTGEHVLVCPEVDREIEPARRLIFEPLPDDVKAQVRLKESFWLPDEAFSVFANARAIVSMEMHSVILALAAGTPALHPAFAEAGRKRWMLRDIGLAHWLFDIDHVSAATLTDALFAICRDYSNALRRVETAMNFVRRRQRETMAVVRNALLQRKKQSTGKQG